MKDTESSEEVSLPPVQTCGSFLPHFELSCEDGAAGKVSGVDGLGTEGTRRGTAWMVLILSSFQPRRQMACKTLTFLRC